MPKSRLQHGGRTATPANAKKPEELLGFAVALGLRSFTARRMDAAVRQHVALQMQALGVTSVNYTSSQVYDHLQGPLTRKLQDHILEEEVKRVGSRAFVTAIYGDYDLDHRLLAKLAWTRAWVAHFIALFGSSLIEPITDLESALKLANTANVQGILNCSALGGNAKFQVAHVMDASMWEADDTELADALRWIDDIAFHHRKFFNQSHLADEVRDLYKFSGNRTLDVIKRRGPHERLSPKKKKKGRPASGEESGEEEGMPPEAATAATARRRVDDDVSFPSGPLGEDDTGMPASRLAGIFDEAESTTRGVHTEQDEVTHRRNQHNKRVSDIIPSIVRRQHLKSSNELIEYLLLNMATPVGGQILASYLLEQQHSLECCQNGIPAFLARMKRTYASYPDMVSSETAQPGMLVAATHEFDALTKAFAPPPMARPRPNLSADGGAAAGGVGLQPPPRPFPNLSALGNNDAVNNDEVLYSTATAYSQAQSDAFSYALPVRPRKPTSEATRLAARNATRDGAMRLMQGALGRARQMAPPAASSSLLIVGDRHNSRGRRMSAANLEASLLQIEHRLNSERLRVASDSEGEEGEGGLDYGRRAPHDGTADAASSGLPPPPSPWYELRPPLHAMNEPGWWMEVLYPTGTDDELLWHGGFVVDIADSEDKGQSVQIFFPDEAFEDWFSDLADDPQIAFHQPGRCTRKTCSCKGSGPRASHGEVKRARLLLGL